jgi:hypothetical protein
MVTTEADPHGAPTEVAQPVDTVEVPIHPAWQTHIAPQTGRWQTLDCPRPVTPAQVPFQPAND